MHPLLLPRLVGGMTVCDDGSWSGTHDDQFTVMTGTFAGHDLAEDTLGWAAWSPYTTAPVEHSTP